MVYRRRRILLSEIDRQCRFAMIAYGDACSALEKRDAERCWYALQGLLAAGMQLNRLLWPPPGGSDWAVGLRGVLEVPDDSPLNLPGLASALDITPTIETWSPPRAGQSGFSSGGLIDAAPAECLRCFDPESGAFTLFGHVVELPPLLNAIADLGTKAEQEQQHLREVI